LPTRFRLAPIFGCRRAGLDKQIGMATFPTLYHPIVYQWRNDLTRRYALITPATDSACCLARNYHRISLNERRTGRDTSYATPEPRLQNRTGLPSNNPSARSRNVQSASLPAIDDLSRYPSGFLPPLRPGLILLLLCRREGGRGGGEFLRHRKRRSSSAGEQASGATAAARRLL